MLQVRPSQRGEALLPTAGHLREERSLHEPLSGEDDAPISLGLQVSDDVLSGERFQDFPEDPRQQTGSVQSTLFIYLYIWCAPVVRFHVFFSHCRSCESSLST